MKTVIEVIIHDDTHVVLTGTALPRRIVDGLISIGDMEKQSKEVTDKICSLFIDKTSNYYVPYHTLELIENEYRHIQFIEIENLCEKTLRHREYDIHIVKQNNDILDMKCMNVIRNKYSTKR